MQLRSFATVKFGPATTCAHKPLHNCTAAFFLWSGFLGKGGTQALTVVPRDIRLERPFAVYSSANRPIVKLLRCIRVHPRPQALPLVPTHINSNIVARSQQDIETYANSARNRRSSVLQGKLARCILVPMKQQVHVLILVLKNCWVFPRLIFRPQVSTKSRAVNFNLIGIIVPKYQHSARVTVLL